MSIQMGDNKNAPAVNPVAAATVVAVDIGSGAPMDVAAFSNLANGNRPFMLLFFSFWNYCLNHKPPHLVGFDL